MELSSLQADFRWDEGDVTPGAAVAQLFGQDADRWSVIFSVGTSGQVAWVSTLGTISQNHGIQLASGTPVVDLNFRDHGAIVSAPWYAWAPVSVVVHWVTVRYVPSGPRRSDTGEIQRLAKAIEELTRTVMRR